MSRTAVVLFNLGGPDSRETIAPFLYNFFRDPNIITAPWFVRIPLAKYISATRSRKEAGSAYARLNFKSPLLENTRAQAGALQEKLGQEKSGDDFKVFVCMRYWHPMADGVAEAVKNYAPERIVLLPLYPQFSTTTTGSSFQSWEKAARKIGLDVPTSAICCYPVEEGFIAASARLVGDACQKVFRDCGMKPRVLFSAHGLPEKIIRAGDPYQWQCERTAEAIAAKLDLRKEDWRICYQSRVGPLKWIGPSTTEELQRAGNDGVPAVIYPHAFVSEHVETLVEIEEEYRHMAKLFGVPHFARVSTVGTADAFITGLARMVSNCAEKHGTISACGQGRCPERYGRCISNFNRTDNP